MTSNARLASLQGTLARAQSSSHRQRFATTPTRVLDEQLLTHNAQLALVEAGLLVPLGDHPNQDLVMARTRPHSTLSRSPDRTNPSSPGEILEIGAFHSIRTRDIPSFDRFFSQLQTYYIDYPTVLPPSPRQYPLQGLNLIRLLTQNRIADFHTTLEGLPAEVLHDNKYVRHPVNLERWMMEGSYSKVWNARSEAPAEEYIFFVESLMGTIRLVAVLAEYTRED